jgi:hypothetical protein
VGETCSEHGGYETCIQGSANLMGRDVLKEVVVDGRILIKWVLNKHCGNLCQCFHI